MARGSDCNPESRIDDLCKEDNSKSVILAGRMNFECTKWKTLHSQIEYENKILEGLSEFSFHESLKQKENNQLDVFLTSNPRIIINRSCGNEFNKSFNWDHEAFVVALQIETEIEHKIWTEKKFACNTVDWKDKN